MRIRSTKALFKNTFEFWWMSTEVRFNRVKNYFVSAVDICVWYVLMNAHFCFCQWRKCHALLMRQWKRAVNTDIPHNHTPTCKQTVACPHKLGHGCIFSRHKPTNPQMTSMQIWGNLNKGRCCVHVSVCLLHISGHVFDKELLLPAQRQGQRCRWVQTGSKCK